ncbi:BCCT family transporter, partial [Staphylococcus epidermidis]
MRLGKGSEKGEFNNLRWGGMLLCGGIGWDILYWGV